MPLAAVALRLRDSVQALTSKVIAQRGTWLRRVQQDGGKALPVFDANALTFIISSWGFDWQVRVYAESGSHSHRSAALGSCRVALSVGYVAWPCALSLLVEEERPTRPHAFHSSL